MLNGKINPADYQKLRQCFFDFNVTFELSIKEAEDVLATLKGDLQDQICSGQYALYDSNYCDTNQVDNKKKQACWNKLASPKTNDSHDI